ncbi:Uncharacterised protein [Mycobacterium tuberculosis]|nr:Uncharacterised protein [Mycobacterium tuberculosis]
MQVEYALTPLGDRIVPLIGTMIDWANRTIDDVRAARARRDAAPA